MNLSPRYRLLFAVASKLKQAPPLGDTIEEIEDGNDVQVSSPGAAPVVKKTVNTRDRLQALWNDVQTVLFGAPGLTPLFFHVLEEILQFFMLRAGASPNGPLPELPPNADTTLLPAIDSILQWQPLWQSEDPSLFQNEDMDAVKLARQTVADNDNILKILDPAVQGATRSKRMAQAILADFAQRMSKNGQSSMGRNYVLNREMGTLRTFVGNNSEQAQETKHLKETVAHEVEAETLARVKQTLQSGGAAAGGAAAGAGAPGQTQTAAPPGAMPIAVPEPIHPKPKRKAKATGSGGGQGPKGGKKPPSTPSVG